MRLIFLILIMTPAIVGHSQTVGDSVRFYLINGDYNSFLLEDIDSITFSNYDKNRVYSDNNMTQIIHTRDSVFFLSLSAIDSVSFINPSSPSGKVTTEYQQVLIDSGFEQGGIGDWSTYNTNDGNNPLNFLTPKLAWINFSNENGDLEMPTKPTPAFMEYWDGEGHYFKKRIVLDIQGNSSRMFIKKNYAVDLFDNSQYNSKGELGKGKAFAIKYGNWVPQSSFHFKAFYQDFFKGVSFISYQICDEVARSKGLLRDRPWKRALLEKKEKNKKEKIEPILLEEDARCIPDGFPCVVYCNGEFYGLFVMAMKKHRDNYHMNKDKKEHIHLDKTSPSFFTGNVNWSRFEVRNPKSLVGTRIDSSDPMKYLKYEEGDELVDSSMEYYDSNNIEHVRSDFVKKAIIRLSERLNEAKSLPTEALKKAYLETYFDIESLLDYILVNNAVQDTDAGDQNWQWITYDGVKWFVCPYDKDRSFGLGGNYIKDPISKGGWNQDNQEPFTTIKILYDKELKAKWKEYVVAGIFTLDNIMQKFKEWTQRFGECLYEKESDRWPESPCNRDPGVDTTNWEWVCSASLYTDWVSFVAGEYCYDPERDFRTFKALRNSRNVPTTNAEYWEEITFDETKEYSENEVCGMGVNFGYGHWWQDVAYYIFKSKTNKNIGNSPIRLFYEHTPRILGFRDDLRRVENYVKQTLEKMNEYVK